MANITVTYSFSNGTAADAGEVNTNFTDLINGTSDGTKDFSINALTCAGSATLNGAVTLGNATTDDLTFTGLCASNFVPKTNAAYDLGTSTLNWQSIYLDNDSTDGGAIYFDASSTKYIKAAADGSDLALAVFTGFDLAGARIKELGYYHEAKSDSYPVTDSDGVSVLLVTTGGSNRTVTLPTAAANDGRVITIKKVDSGAGTLIIDGEGAETIDGDATKIITSIYDFIEVICDGSAWHIINQRIAVKWQRKYLVSNTAADGTLSDLTFSNLVVGRTYKVALTAQFKVITASGTDYALINITHNSATISQVLFEADSETNLHITSCSSTVTFVAAATSLTFVLDINAAGSVLGGTNATFTILHEMQDYINVTTL